MTRNDVHSPKNLVTEDYEYIFSEVNHIDGVPGWVIRNGDFGLELARKIAATDKLGRGTHQCHHCGAHINYFAVLEHIPTGDLICVGETCLGNRFERATEDFHRLRKQAELDRKKFRIKNLRLQFVEDNPDLAWLNDDNVPEVVAWNDFVHDIARKFKMYGELSDAQVNAVRRVYEKSLENEAKRATEPKINWIPAPVSNERVVVTGEVLGSKWVYSDYGYGDSVLKIMFMVNTDQGSYKLWMTAPKGMQGDKGERARIKVKVMAGWADDDPSLGKGNRPHLVEHLGYLENDE